MPWNYGDILDAVADAVRPDAPAFVHGETRVTWGDATKRMNRLARALIARGAKPGDKVAFYLRNGTEYSEALGACYPRARLVHVNVNYRYKADEVRYILENSDAVALIYGFEFRDTVSQIRDALPAIKTFIIEVGDGDTVARTMQEDYADLTAEGDGSRLAIKRSPDDMLFIYTGGTTGMPKGVMWRHGDLCMLWHNRLERTVGYRPPTLEGLRRRHQGGRAGAGARCPRVRWMHGTGVHLGLDRDALGRHGGDGGQPLARSACDLERSGEKQSARHLHRRRPVRQAAAQGAGRGAGALRSVEHDDHDVVGRDVERRSQARIAQTHAAAFAGRQLRLDRGDGHGRIRDDQGRRGADRRVSSFSKTPSSSMRTTRLSPRAAGNRGWSRSAGLCTMGYYKDPEKTARTFRTIGNVRYSIPGDHARVDADGAITLLGRGSNCINTAGEKVFPEEVEEALKTHPSIEDALVLGVPDEKWGQAITGVVKLAPDGEFDEAALREHVRTQLAGYKTPKRILIAEVNLRAPNGKADYKSASEFARTALGIAG